MEELPLTLEEALKISKGDKIKTRNSWEIRNLSKIKKENFYNNLVIIITPQDMTDDMNIAEEIINFKKESNVNFICCLLGEESFKHSIELLEENNIICFSEIERAAKLINNLHKI